MNHQTKLFLLLLLILTGISGCKKDQDDDNKPGDIWDIDTQGIPQFVSYNYIELQKIARISRFRSAIGHDYSDGFEICRSMKHYFEPKSTEDWSSVKVYAPVSGVLTRVEQEAYGTKLEIMSDSMPAFRFQIFHLNLLHPLQVNDHVAAGDQVGTHVGAQTMSDISVIVNDPTRSGRFVSWFYVMKDPVFDEYRLRGVGQREDFIIPKSVRDSFPIDCTSGFVAHDTIQNWVTLK